MSDWNVIDFFLTGILVYGSLMLSLALFLGALGVPVPGTLLVLAGGAFVQQGVLEWKLTFLLGLFAAVCGDSLSYTLGRVAKGWVMRRFRHVDAWQKAQQSFTRRGGAAIYLSRFFFHAAGHSD